MIYLDYAATSPLREEALEAMLPYFKEAFGNPDSLHACGRRAAAALQSARDAIAAALGVQPSEVRAVGISYQYKHFFSIFYIDAGRIVAQTIFRSFVYACHDFRILVRTVVCDAISFVVSTFQ